MKIITLLLIINLLSFIIVRHDVKDKKFLKIGADYRKSIVNLNLLEEIPDGMATFIDDDWLITAAHCAVVVKQKIEKEGIHQVEFDGKKYEAQKVIVHPEYYKDGAYDLALIKLKQSPKQKEVYPLYKGSGELNKVILIAGYGEKGTGLTGPDGNDKQLRGGTNKILEATDYWLKFVFEEPGDKNITPYEAISGPGDSGGPAFLKVNGKVYLAGVGSGQSTAATGGKEGLYGVKEYYVRVSRYAGWIEAAMQ